MSIIDKRISFELCSIGRRMRKFRPRYRAARYKENVSHKATIFTLKFFAGKSWQKKERAHYFASGFVACFSSFSFDQVWKLGQKFNPFLSALRDCALFLCRLTNWNLSNVIGSICKFVGTFFLQFYPSKLNGFFLVIFFPSWLIYSEVKKWIVRKRKSH